MVATNNAHGVERPDKHSVIGLAIKGLSQSESALLFFRGDFTHPVLHILTRVEMLTRGKHEAGATDPALRLLWG